ncbi:hypothetical protein ABHQ57_08820 [Tenacibaculum sp. ZH5_bin.1]|uniref:hypothetical protein n=1 Tax=Tenacibaculum TaxID=104267 RepID=UPI001431ACB6|nr:hypothetical protein [Tenacibaculum mesophilum]KAF9657921.1 hypothetical protein HBA12_11925 [Tenacibaculum mesophilum]
MNLETIDEFLFFKGKITIENYLSYLKKGLDFVKNNEIDDNEELQKLIEKYYSNESIYYQVISTTFVNEVFHIVETYLKANLISDGEYLIYPSIDKYPEHKEKLIKHNENQRKNISNVLTSFTKAVLKNKELRVEQLSKDVGKIMFQEEKEILVNSITCSESLYRLEKYLNWDISKEMKERFKLFIENRNEIIHFNKLTNLTFSCSHSLYVLLSIASSNTQNYPLFSKIINLITDIEKEYNLLIHKILYNSDTYKALDKISNNSENLIKVIKNHNKECG